MSDSAHLFRNTVNIRQGGGVTDGEELPYMPSTTYAPEPFYILILSSQ